MTTLGALHQEARDRLAQAGVENAALDARLLVEHFSGASRIDAISEPRQAVGAEVVAAVRDALHRRIAHEPIHRILGCREFYGLKLKLSPATLEPRPDTETLVDLVLPFVRRTVESIGACSILDLGAGTGAIALALLGEAPQAVAVASDISPDALATCRANADLTGVGDRLSTTCSDWFADIGGRFHLIVSNPPYVRTEDIDGLAREVRLFDPRTALDGGADGLTAYRAIAEGAGRHMHPNGRLAVEVGIGQRQDARRIFEDAGMRELACASDLSGIERALLFAL